MKKLLFILILVLSVFTLNACRRVDNVDTDTTKTGKAYAITHKNYVGFTTVKVKSDKVTDIEIDEVYLPNDWAEITAGEEAPDDVIVSGTKWIAKYIVIGDKNFTGTLRETAIEKQTIKYSAEGIDDLYTWLKDDEDNCKWYVEQLLGNNAYIATSTFEESDYVLLKKFTKSESNYWPAGISGLGWKANMEAIKTALKGTKMDQADNLTKADEENDKFWRIGDVKTGATLTDFRDYYNLVKLAYDKAK